MATTTTIVLALLLMATAHATCPDGFKNVVFNTGFNPLLFRTIQAAGVSSWLTFDPSSHGAPADVAMAQIPMMAFASNVAEAVQMVNGPNPPKYMLTFNEPDYSYGGYTPTMTPAEAAAAIGPLLQSPGSQTKFIAPGLAYQWPEWLDQFYGNCSCRNFFHAHNIHVYSADVNGAMGLISKFHSIFNDKPLWITEISPTSGQPCDLDENGVESWMNTIFQWSAGQNYIEKLFWNSGNWGSPLPNPSQCNPSLTDQNGNPLPLLNAYGRVQC